MASYLIKHRDNSKFTLQIWSSRYHIETTGQY